MEKLCLAKLQFSTLKKCSPEFFEHHPNPYIKVFLDLAKSPNATYAPPHCRHGRNTTATCATR